MPAPKNRLHRDQPDPADPPATGPASGPTPEPSSIPQADRAAPPTSDGTAHHDVRRRRTFDPSRLSLLIVAILVGSALFVGGYTLGARVATTPGTPASQEAEFDPFWDVYSLIQKDYAGSPKPTEDQLVRAAINGMMQSLNDPWSYYQAPSDFESSLLSVGGQAQGIGVEVQLQPVDPNSGTSCSTIGDGCELAVVQPICGSPAAAAGIQAGDVIVTVGGASLDGLTIDQATALIKGTNDTSVTLGLLRGSTTIQLSIVRTIYNQCEVASKTLANGAVNTSRERHQRPRQLAVRSGAQERSRGRAAQLHPRPPRRRRRLRPGRGEDRERVHSAPARSCISRMRAATRPRSRPTRAAGHRPFDQAGRAGRREHRLGGGDPGRSPAGPRPGAA